MLFSFPYPMSFHLQSTTPQRKINVLTERLRSDWHVLHMAAIFSETLALVSISAQLCARLMHMVSRWIDTDKSSYRLQLLMWHLTQLSTPSCGI